MTVARPASPSAQGLARRAGLLFYSALCIALLGALAGGIHSHGYNRGVTDQSRADHSREQIEAIAQQRLGLCGWLETVCKSKGYDPKLKEGE